MRKIIILLFVWILSISTYSIAQEPKIPYEFRDGQPASASEINANFRALRDSINFLGEKIQIYSKEIITENKNRALQQEGRLKEIETLITKLQREIKELRQKNTSIPAPRDPVNDIYGVQELGHLTAQVTKLVVNPKHDVTVFIKYNSKKKMDFYIGLSGCAANWRRKSYLVDDVGNIYTIKTASGIGYVGCGFINDPVLLKPGGIATFTLVFERPRYVNTFGKVYSLSLAQNSGTLNADGKWGKMQDFNVSIGDISPNE